ncbi:MAG: SDR family NAD(P)-dependent oxidoreductase [Parahaliea sp.]
MSSGALEEHQYKPFSLKGRTALVTGASGGLGERFARVLAEAGAAVALAARREPQLEDIANNIRERGGKAVTCALDVGDARALDTAVQSLEDSLGVVDILVNNAGVPGLPMSAEPDFEDIDRLLAVNIRAPYLLSLAVGKRLIRAGMPGNIVNIASIGALSYTPGTRQVLYCASKSALLRMTETLSVEWAREGINVNAIAPGLFRSQMSAPYLASMGDRMVEKFPRKRVCEPSQLDSTLLYLVSASSGAVTGACIRVNDAQHAI